MYHEINLGTGQRLRFSDYPQICPECHQTTTPNFSNYRKVKKGTAIYAHLYCPNPSCDSSYVAKYEIQNSLYYLDRIMTGQPIKESFPEEIEELSPMFVQIYNEASMAEQLDLLEICGVGYRKAVEFLIKDFLIKSAPGQISIIKQMHLGKCINDLVEDAKIKTASKRAVWLGNDQTHYVKKWEEKDLADLKKLIKLTVNWVESEILTSDLENSMPE